ncbi:amidohydrolase family protein [Cohnella rhizosphaerae]|uniref:Amidohydrolase n=1 Tax=Cohnella rhizosphaerae TaxID=1457232 RepID=A0A9X4QWZ7_9BACL|nr:amidohydrolase family protein [Cohnella rhizosphaerae]MDG0812892.1 amidohydrolase [Cohnella rhizosphaerae]
MIIDVHAHLGTDRVFDEAFTEREQWDKIEKFGIDFTILQPALVHTIEEVRAQHDVIATLARSHPDRFAGMANPNPHLPDDVYASEVRRCIEKLGFVGIKLHTSAHAVNPTSRDGRKVFEWGRRLGVPVMVHTGAGIPFANPSHLIPVAQSYPDVNIVIAHCGMMVLAGETHIAMQACPNLYADITWTGGFLIRHWVRELGAERFMFGTDHADNCGTELAKVRTSDLTAEEQEWLLYRSALRVYGLQDRIGRSGA